MNENVICVSDLHFAEWPNQSPEKDYRKRLQPLKLAERLVEVMKEYDTQYLFILGDLINSWNEDPSVIKVLTDFYQIIIDAIPNAFIGYIEGQHDMMIRDKYAGDNSFVHLAGAVFPNNVHYLHNKELNINDTSIYFSSFHRKEPIYPPHHVNIFLSHITFGMTTIDDSNFDLCVAGDIHLIWDEGKCHSCSPAIPLYAHQEKKGWISVINLKGSESTFKRIPSDNDKFQFLVLESEVRRQTSENLGKSLTEISFDSNHVMELINEEIDKHNLKEVHNKIPLNNLPTPIDFNLHLKRLVLDNIRSIDHLDLNLEDLKGINYIVGPTGAGKSSIFYGLITGLCGAQKSELERKTNTITKKPLKIQLWLNYHNQEFYIERSVKDLKLTIDGENCTLNKKETQAKIEELLPFVRYWNYFYIKANAHYFDSVDKAELMRVLFNLKVFDYLYEESNNLVKSTNKQIRETDSKIISQKAVIETRTNDLTKAEQDFVNLVKPDIDLTDLKDKVKRVIDLQKKLESHKTTLISIKSCFSRDYEFINKTRQKLPADISATQKQLEDLKIFFTQTKNQNNMFEIKTRELNVLQTKIKTLQSIKIDNCPHCGKPLKSLDVRQIEALQAQEKALAIELANLHKVDLDGYIDKQKQLTIDLNSWNELQKTIQNVSETEQKIALAESVIEKETIQIKKALDFYKVKTTEELSSYYFQKEKEFTLYMAKQNSIESLKKQLEGLYAGLSESEKQKEVLEKELAETEKYVSLFDLKNLESIPYAILNKLVKYLNTDTVAFTASTDTGKFSINASIKIGNQWISYEDCSDGQKNYLDLFILIRISAFLGGVGMMIMDEPIANMDASYLRNACILLGDINADTILISSHSKIDGYDRQIKVFQNEEGLTQVDF